MINVDEMHVVNISVGELLDIDVAYFTISKEKVSEIFGAANRLCRNADYEPDESYVDGDIQFNFDRRTKEINEILLAPSYKDEDNGISSGDFMDITDKVSDNIIAYAKTLVYPEPDSICEWIMYDSRTLVPKFHDRDNPYWRIPSRKNVLNFCPYCGKPVFVGKMHINEYIDYINRTNNKEGD